MGRKIGKCKLCGRETEIVARGLCRKCYDKVRYAEKRDEILQRVKQYQQKKRERICPICGGPKEPSELICKKCREKYRPYIGGNL